MKRGFLSTGVLKAAFGIGIAMTTWSLCAERITLDLREKASSRPTGTHARLLSAPVSSSGEGGRRLTLAAGAATVEELAVGDVITLSLFDDIELSLTLVKKMSNPTGSDMFVAEVAGYDGIASAIVLRNADGLTIDVQDFQNRKVYRVISTASGVTVEERETPKESHGCGGALEPNLPAATSARPRLMAGLPSEGDGECIDILVAYDAAAKTWVDANGGGMQTFAETQVAKMNTALRNDGLDSYFAFRLVGVMSISESDTTLSSALNKVTEGAWSSVRAKRDEVGADLVTMLVDTGSNVGNTGLGWSLRSDSNLSYFKEIAYHTCAIRAVAGGHTMTHEAGHNMGAGHCTADAIDTSKISPGPQYNTYSAGFYFTGNDGKQYHTIMAYNYDGKSDTIYASAPLFSTPHYSWKGVAAGDASHNNAQTLFNTWKAVSQFRTHVVPFEPDGSELLDVEWTINDGVLTGVKLNGKTDITIPSSVTLIDDDLFLNNTSLTSVRFTSDIVIGEQAFKGCTSLSSVTFADGIQVGLCPNCFEGTALTEFTAPYDFATYGDVFKNCTQLKKATMPSWFRDNPDYGEASLKPQIFPGCPSDLVIEYFWFYDTVVFNKNDGTGTKATQRVKVFTDEPLNTIADIGWTRDGYSFAGWGTSASATSVTYSNGAMIYTTNMNRNAEVSLYAIWREGGGSGGGGQGGGQGGGSGGGSGGGQGGGGGNSGDVEWIIENRVLVGVRLNGATEIGIPETVTNIAPNVFQGCTGLISVYIGPDVESIGAGAFDGCSRLVELWCGWGSKLVSVGANAFRGTALVEIEMPLYTATIGDGVLASCPKLEELWLPFPKWYEYANAQGVQTLKGRLLPSCPASAGIVFYWPQAPVKLMLNDGTDASFTYYADCERYWEDPAVAPYYTDEYRSAIPTPAEIEEETELDGDPLSWSRAGYNFIGWSENPNATEATWANEATFVTLTPRTLYAVWQKIPENPEYTVGLFKVGALQATVKVSGKLTLGRMKYTLPTAANFAPYLKSGETLIGWATAPDAIVPDFPPGYTTYISGNTSFYAVYTWFARYNVTYSRNDPTYVDPNAPVKPTWTVIDWTPWFEGTGDDQAAILNQLNSLPQVQQDTALEEYGLFEEYYANLGPVGDPVSETRSFYAFTTNAVLPRITITLPRAADFGWTVEGYCLDKWLDEEDQAYQAGTEVAIVGDTSFSATWAVPPEFTFTLMKNDPSFDFEAVFADYQKGLITSNELENILAAQRPKTYTILGESADETEREVTLPTAASLGWNSSGPQRLVAWEYYDVASGFNATVLDGGKVTLKAGGNLQLDAKWGYSVGGDTYVYIDKNGNLTGGITTTENIPASITLPTFATSIKVNSLNNLWAKKIVIPSSVTNIDFRACGSYNPYLESLVIPGSVKEISSEAFVGCKMLKELIIKDGVETIQTKAFNSLMQLTGTLTLPASVKTVGEEAFANCYALKELVVQGDDVWLTYKTFAGCWALERVSFGGGRIGASSFYGCGELKHFNFGKVTSIGANAFEECRELQSVETGDDLTYVGEKAFYRCWSITNMVLSAKLTEVWSGAFSECMNLENFTLRSGVVPIIDWFGGYSASKVKYVSLGEGIAPGEGLGSVPAGSSSPFYVNGLFGQAETVVFGHGIASIGANAFTDNHYVLNVRIDGATVGKDAFNGCSQITNLVFGSGNITLGENAFRGCPLLTKLEFGAGNVTLGTRAFYCDTGLKSVKFGTGNTQVGYAVFAGCSGITELDLGAVTSLGNNAFTRCYGLTALDLPDTLSTIGNYAFENCTNIASVTFGTGLSGIGTYAFHYCYGLTSLNIENVSSATIGDYAFSDCTGLETVNLGAGVISVGADAFANCPAIIRATLGGDITALGDGIFRNSNNLLTIWMFCSRYFSTCVRISGNQNTVIYCPQNVVTDSYYGFLRPLKYDSNGYVAYPYVIIDPAKGKAITEILYVPPRSTVAGYPVYPNDVILEIPPSVTNLTVKDGGILNTANIRVVSGNADITSSLGAIPAASNGQISLGAVTVKPEVVEAALDVEQGAVIELNPEEPVLTTSETVPGLTYTLMEGSSLEAMRAGDRKVGDGTKWTPNVTVKGGSSGFYTIKVEK